MMELMTERLESLKAGVIGSISLGLAFLSTSLINVFWLDKYFFLVGYNTIDIVNLQVLLSGVIAGFSGFLFGVTNGLNPFHEFINNIQQVALSEVHFVRARCPHHKSFIINICTS